MYQNKTNHYWKHHRAAVEKVWDNMSNGFRAAVAKDTTGKSDETKDFLEMVEKEVDYQYNNPYNPENNKYSFKYSYYEY